MSARKAGTRVPQTQQRVTVEARQTKLSLPPEDVLFRRNGIEFRSPVPLSLWTEMTVTVQSPRDNSRINCMGVVVACNGNKHTGYHVSMLFTSVSKQSQARLDALVYSSLA
ncbi:MAG: PilZ domain-containing protein [Verrucomicrobiae bacterium]|nr:PilZ domain-containing protein [Verrucomicrobiae bacterium]MCX7721682.1 PilZ domain-containing protein [Verrucomicrobiae bacterium]MDW7980960.1 PilZ domain-containing protein [Verrucomicrobiales bacterium]